MTTLYTLIIGTVSLCLSPVMFVLYLLKTIVQDYSNTACVSVVGKRDNAI
jgi:hypothetical protein